MNGTLEPQIIDDCDAGFPPAVSINRENDNRKRYVDLVNLSLAAYPLVINKCERGELSAENLTKALGLKEVGRVERLILSPRLLMFSLLRSAIMSQTCFGRFNKLGHRMIVVDFDGATQNIAERINDGIRQEFKDLYEKPQLERGVIRAVDPRFIIRDLNGIATEYNYQFLSSDGQITSTPKYKWFKVVFDKGIMPQLVQMDAKRGAKASVTPFI